MADVTLCDRYQFDSELPIAQSRARIYKAWDTEHKKHVAVKEIRTNTNLKSVEFSREMKAYERLSGNENVAAYLDWGRLGDFPDNSYIVLEWYEQDLHAAISDGNMRFGNWDEYFDRIGESILNVLVTLHAEHLFHRDLKPHNILLGSNDEPKIIDFGTLKDVGLGEFTMGGWKSWPYTPYRRATGHSGELEPCEWPEFELPPRGPGARDCWSFVAVSMSCLLGEVWTEENAREFDLPSRLSECDVPPNVAALLRTCLVLDDNSPQNAIELQERLRVVGDDVASFRTQDTFPVKVTQKVQRDVMEELGLPSTKHAERVIHEDLAGELWFESDHQDVMSQVFERSFAIYGERFRYTCVLEDMNQDNVVLKSAQLERTERLIKVHERGVRLKLAADFSNHSDVEIRQQAVHDFKSRVVNDLGGRHESRADLAYNPSFKNWHRALDFSGELCQKQASARWRFEAIEQSGARALLVVAGEGFSVRQDDVLILNPGRGGTRECKVTVETTDGDRVTVTPTGPYSIADLDDGELSIDTHGTKKAIERQRDALSRIEDGKSARKELADLLVGISQVGEILLSGKMLVFAQELDADKELAVLGAFETEDFFMVEGPPGTGKTRLIAEIAWQQLQEKPESRILISAQTHIALEHALSGVAALGGDGYILRYRPGGQRDEDRRADWSLASQMERWKESALQSTEHFLEELAREHSVDVSNVQRGIELEELLLARADLKVVKATIKARMIGSAEVDSVEPGLELEKRHRALKTRIQEICKVAARALGDDWTIRRLQTAEVNELHDLLESLGLSDAESQVRKLIPLQREWISRFGIDNDFRLALIRQCKVIGATCVGLPGLPGIEDLTFDLCILDEAAKATALESIIPMASSLKWIIVGDRRQLPPMTVGGKVAQDLKEEMSIDDELLEATVMDHLSEILPGSKQLQLRTQHRMVEPLGELISQVFYDGSLVHGATMASPKASWIDEAMGKRVVCFSTSGLDNRRERHRGTSPYNTCEIAEIRQLLTRFHGAYERAGVSDAERFSIALMSPYLSQVREIKRQLPSIQGECPHFKLSAHTVDSFQGQEARLAVFSVTRSNPDGHVGFVEDERRLNVALSRGMDGLVIVGDADMISALPTTSPLRRVIQYVRSTDTCSEVRLGVQ